MNIDLKLAPSHQGDLVIAIFAEEPTFKQGDTVDLQYRVTNFGTLKARSIRQITLGEVTYDDLIGSVYGTPQVFWSRLEATLGTGLPAEYPIWVVTFGPELTKDPDIEAIEEDAYEAPPKPKTKPKKSAKE